MDLARRALVSDRVFDAREVVLAIREVNQDFVVLLCNTFPRVLVDGLCTANLAKLNIVPVCFEQPLPRSDIKGLAKLSRMTSVPVLLDESVTTVDEVVRAYHAGAGSMINIKITKSGVVESLRMITAAKSLGMGLMIGGMLETEIAMGFSLQMAAGLGGFNLIDLDTPFFIEQRLTVNSPWHNPTALLDASRTAGSGLMLFK